MWVILDILYFAFFGAGLAVGIYWWRHPRRMVAFLRGTVFERWRRGLVPFMPWALILVCGSALALEAGTLWSWIG